MKKNRNNYRVKVKKKRNKNINRKPIDHYVQVQAIANSGGKVQFEFGENGKVICHEAVEGSVKSCSSYQRQSGKEKYVTQSPSIGNSAHVNQMQNIQSNYRLIAGMDTNDYDYQGCRISVSSSFLSDSATKKKSFSAQLLPAFIISEVREDLNPEVVGWHLFFKHILPMLEVNSERRLGFVVDSELGKHQSINNREFPYYQEFYLPENVGLIYASSDTGTGAPNQLVRACDRASRELFGQIQEGSIILPAALGGASRDFTGYAFVNFENSQLKVQI